MGYSNTFVVLVALFVTALITANITAVKLIGVFGLVLPAAVVVFPISYICGDVLTEVYGYRAARRVIWLGFLCNLLAVAAIYLGGILPAAPFWQDQGAYEAILGYLRATPSVRDVVVSGGDMANLPIAHLEDFVSALMDIESIRDIRLATKGLMGLPQHFLQDDVLAGLDRLARKAVARGVDIAVHTHINQAASVTPLVARATRKLLEMGFRDVRNQGVLLRGVNDSPEALLDLCFTLLDHAKVMPYYLYMCDMIPSSEHWRISVGEAQRLQHSIMGYLPGFATPRIVCDVPLVGKRWVHQVDSYDAVRGISRWTKNYRTGIESDDPAALERAYEYYDPIASLPEEGRRYWRERAELQTV